MGVEGEFERRLEQELRLFATRALEQRPTVLQPAYQVAAAGGSRPPVRSRTPIRRATSLVAIAAALVAGTGLATAATGSASPVSLGQRLVRAVSEQVTRVQNGQGQQLPQDRAAAPQVSPSALDKRQDNGRGNTGGPGTAPGRGGPGHENSSGQGNRVRKSPPPGS